MRYFAGARAAAGRSEEPAAAGTLGELRHEMVRRHGARLSSVLDVSSFLIDGALTRDSETQVPDGSTVDVLPPFAGG